MADSQKYNRRNVLKVAAGVATTGSIVGEVGATTSGNYWELVRDVRSFVREYGMPEYQNDVAQIENEMLVESDTISTQAASVMNEYPNVVSQSMDFEDGPKKLITGCRGADNDVVVKFDGKQYNIQMVEEIEAWLTRRVNREDRRNYTTTKDSDYTTQNHKNIVIGEKETFDIAKESDTKNPTYPGIYKTQNYTVPSEGETHCALQIGYAGDATINAKVWMPIAFIESDSNKREVDITFEGDIRGVATSALSGGAVRASGFLEDKNGELIEDEAAFQRGMGLVDGWGVDRQYEENITAKNIDPGYYRIGIKLKINAAAATWSASSVDFAGGTDKSWTETNGAFDFAYFEVDWDYV
jgi:hypothetical protein